MYHKNHSNVESANHRVISKLRTPKLSKNRYGTEKTKQNSTINRKPVRSLEGKKEPDREEEWKQIFPYSSGGSFKTIIEALAQSPLHTASRLYSSPDLITPRTYLVTDNAPDKDWRLTVMYRYRVEWWDEGYEHYRSVVFAHNFSELTSPLSPASTIGDWRPVLTSNEEK